MLKVQITRIEIHSGKYVWTNSHQNTLVLIIGQDVSSSAKQCLTTNNCLKNCMICVICVDIQEDDIRNVKRNVKE